MVSTQVIQLPFAGVNLQWRLHIQDYTLSFIYKRCTYQLAMYSLNAGHNFKARHVHQVAQLVGSLLLALAGHSQLSFEDVDQVK